MNHRLAFASLAALPLVTLAAAAFAEPIAAVGVAPAPEPAGEGRLPVAEAERGITNPRFILSPEADIGVVHLAGLGSFANLSLGASFSITDDLSVRAVVLPFELAAPGGGGFHYGQATGLLGGIGDPGPGVGATYRFLKGDIEIGASLDLNLITVQDFSGVVIAPGVPVRFHVGKQIRIDTGAYLPITRASENETIPTIGPAPGSISFNSVGLSVPASFLYDITEPIHVGAGTGFAIDDFSQAGDTFRIPVGVFAGYAVAGKDGPILDIDPFFTFPQLFTPGADSKTETGTWVLGVNVGGFIYL